MIDAFSLNFTNPVTDYLKRTQAQIAASSPQTAPDGHILTDAEIADRARAQGAGAGAASSLGAATTAGQQTESAQAGAMAASSAAAAQPASAPERAPDGHILTDAEIADRARARGAGASAAASSAAASTAGQQQESTQAGQMASASAAAAKPASVPTPPPPPIAPPPPADPFHSVSGDNVKAYLDKKSATLGQDPGAISEAGQLYADRVTNGLKTPDASSVNAQNTQDTAASRRAYLARVQADEAIGQSGFSAGTAQADRIRTNSQAGVDEANQAGQNSVNAYVRQRTEDNMNRAKDLETQQYGRNLDTLQQVQGQDLQEYGRSEKATDRGLQAAATAYAHGRDTVADQHWDTTNTQQQAQQGVENSHWNTTNTQQQTQQGVDNAHWDTMNKQQQDQLAVENKAVADGKDETAKRNLLAGLPEGPAKNAVMAGLADGSLTIATALAKVMNPDGSIKDGTEGGGINYRGQTPGQLGLAGETEYAQQTVDLQYPNLKNTNPQDYLAKVNAEILKKRNATDSPINTATDAADKAAVEKKIANGEPLTPADIETGKTSGAIPEFTPANLGGYKDQQVADLIGKPINIGGQVYTVLQGGRTRTGSGDFSNAERHTDWTSVKDANGTTLYVYDGKINPKPPKEVSNDVSPFGF